MSPILDATFQALAITALSNAFAQGFQVYHKQSFSAIDAVTFMHFAFSAMLFTPPNYAFQKFLEDSFPTTVPCIKIGDERAKGDRRMTEEREGKEKLSISNTVIKFVLDQSLGGPVNTVLFIAVMGMFNGMGISDISASVRRDFWPMLSAGWTLWPMVCLLNLVVVPFQYRMLVGNLAGFGWGVFISLRSL